MTTVRVTQIRVAKKMDISVENSVTETHVSQNVLSPKKVGNRSLSRDAITGMLDKTVMKSTAVIAR